MLPTFAAHAAVDAGGINASLWSRDDPTNSGTPLTGSREGRTGLLRQALGNDATGYEG